MVQVGKGQYMNKFFFLLVLIAYFFQGCSFKDKNIYVSTREYQMQEQLVYNIAKKLLYDENSDEYIIDTTWNNLKLTKRDIRYLLFTVQTNVLQYELSSQKINDTTVSYNLKISRQINQDEKDYYHNTSYLHKIFWNNLEEEIALLHSEKNKVK